MSIAVAMEVIIVPASDQIVTAKIVLQAQLELQRLGIHKSMSLLENTEPDLTEVLIETTTSLYHQLLDAGASGKQARRIHDQLLTLLLVCIRSLQKGHAALWQQDTGKDLAVRLNSPPGPAPNTPTS